jgi:hypothetical protein
LQSAELLRTNVYGIYTDANGNTTIVGQYITSSGVGHGFSKIGGVWTPLNEPSGTTSSAALGVSGNTIVGTYVDSAGHSHGFTETSGMFTTIDDPNGTGTNVTGVYGSTIVGIYTDSAGNSHGFTETGNAWTTVDFPGATGTQIFGISSNGTLVGRFSDVAGGHGFIATPNASNPISISVISPSSATALGPAFMLTVNGTGFLTGCTVQWNGSALPTTFVNATQLTASVPAALIASQGSASVTVACPGGPVSSLPCSRVYALLFKMSQPDNLASALKTAPSATPPSP